MPVRYSGVRAVGEVEVKAVQQLMFQAMRRDEELRSWAQARQWWVEQPPNTLRDWQAAAPKISSSGAVKEMAARVEDLVKTSLQPTFDLIKVGQAPAGGPARTAISDNRGGDVSSGPSGGLPCREDSQGDKVAWRAPARRGAHAHACMGVLPLCKQKLHVRKAAFKGTVTTFTDSEHAKNEGRSLCPVCVRLVAKDIPY